MAGCLVRDKQVCFSFFFLIIVFSFHVYFLPKTFAPTGKWSQAHFLPVGSLVLQWNISVEDQRRDQLLAWWRLRNSQFAVTGFIFFSLVQVIFLQQLLKTHCFLNNQKHPEATVKFPVHRRATERPTTVETIVYIPHNRHDNRLELCIRLMFMSPDRQVRESPCKLNAGDWTCSIVASEKSSRRVKKETLNWGFHLLTDT